MRKMKNKVIFKEFVCPKCGGMKNLKIDEICVDCRDKQIILELNDNIMRKLATSAY